MDIYEAAIVINIIDIITVFSLFCFEATLPLTIQQLNSMTSHTPFYCNRFLDFQ